MRISRALALAGLGSRRKCETYVKNGAIRVNSEVVTDLGRQVDIENDHLFYRNKLLIYGETLYYALNKPKGYLTSARDPHNAKTVFDLLPHKLVTHSRQVSMLKRRVFPIGRLDKDSMGLLLFTNDGDTAFKLTHPRYQVSKWYQVRLDRPFNLKDKDKMLKGIRLREGWATVKRVKSISRRILQLEICEGKNREVRRIFEKLGYEVVDLLRIAFGPIGLGELVLGRGRYLNKQEVAALKDAVAQKEPEKKKTVRKKTVSKKTARKKPKSR